MATGTSKRLLHWAMVLEYWHLVSAYQFAKLHLCLKVNYKNLILHLSFDVLHPRAVTLLQGKKLASLRSRFTWSVRERGVAGPATHASKGPFWVFKCASFFTAVRWEGWQEQKGKACRVCERQLLCTNQPRAWQEKPVECLLKAFIKFHKSPGT